MSIEQEPKGMKTLIHLLLEKNKLKSKLDDIHIVEVFKQNMEGASKQIKHIYSQKGILYVKFSSAVLRQELLYRKNDLIKSINDHLQDQLVKDIKFL